MKELSIEEKAKRYDEAIEIAKSEYQTHKSFNGFREMLIRIFPELKESEDKKIRKCICLCLEECVHSDIIRDYEKDKCLAWLEKQGSQILANSAKTCKDEQKPIKASYTTIVETGNGGVNTVVERELSVDGCYGKQEPFDYENANIQQKDFATKKSDQEEGIIEIPFGAKDSELQEATYYIPSGFHAEIDGNKVVISRKSCVYNPYKAVVESIAKMCDKYKSRMCDEKEAKDFLANVAVKCREAAEYDKKYIEK